MILLAFVQLSGQKWFLAHSHQGGVHLWTNVRHILPQNQVAHELIGADGEIFEFLFLVESPPNPIVSVLIHDVTIAAS